MVRTDGTTAGPPRPGAHGSKARIVVHDFSGHPFQAELARSLAHRGHDVLHVHCSSYTSGKGAFETDGSGGSITYREISVGPAFSRYRLLRRIAQELRYGRRFTKVAGAFKPDVIISCNDPLIAKAVFALWAGRKRVAWVFWLQDLYSIALTNVAVKRSRLLAPLGAAMQAIERRLLQSCGSVVSITDDFKPVLDRWGVDPAKCTVIENWAPLDEVVPRPREGPWRELMGIGDRFLYLYAGTLGLKHNPDVLHALAAKQDGAMVVVVSEGLGAERLKVLLQEDPLDNLLVLPFQPWELVADVLGAADVLVVLLQADAGVFSVPSKILTSLCAGRPILAAIPSSNLGARTIQRAEAGIVVAPGDDGALLEAAELLRTDDQLRTSMGVNARSYAQATFDIDPITDRFLGVLARTVGGVGRKASILAAIGDEEPTGSGL
jgi:colanic acid biosynthesis glycosyl transferase WcaI